MKPICVLKSNSIQTEVIDFHNNPIYGKLHEGRYTHVAKLPRRQIFSSVHHLGKKEIFWFEDIF